MKCKHTSIGISDIRTNKNARGIHTRHKKTDSNINDNGVLLSWAKVTPLFWGKGKVLILVRGKTYAARTCMRCGTKVKSFKQFLCV